MTSDSTFDFSDFSETFSEATKDGIHETGKALDLKELTDTKEMEVVRLGRGTMKIKDEEVPKIWGLFRALDGKNKGQSTFRNWPILKSADSIRYTLQDLKTIGVKKLDSMEDLNDDENLATAYGNRVAVSIYTKPGKTDPTKQYGNMKIQRRTYTASESK